MKNKIKEILKNKAVSFYIFLTVAVFVALLIHDWQIGFNKIDWDAIWIEAHGLFFDIIVLGLLLTIYNHFRDKEEKIERYMDEIDDFRMWNEREAAHRIRGILKRLEKLGVTNVKLDRCHLCNLEMIAQRLSGALLHKTDLNSTDFVLFPNCATKK